MGLLEDIFKWVEEHPYETAGIAAGIGVVAGILLANSGRKTYDIKAGTKNGGSYVVNSLLPSINQVNQEILLCDPYISLGTLVLFGVFKGKIKKVKIITKKIKCKLLFLTQKALYEQFSGIQFEIKESDKVHDRFMLYGGTRCVMIGSSLDNLGTRDTTVVEDPNQYATKVKLFDERWTE